MFTNTIIPAVVQANSASFQNSVSGSAGLVQSGDEPYTLAMMMLEHPTLANWAIDLIATDISETALGAARDAVYGSYAVRNVPPLFINKYFRHDGPQYFLSEKIKELVKFSHMNLYDGTRLKIIRCRGGCGKNYRRAGGDLDKMGGIYAPVGAANDPGGLNGGWSAGVRKQIGAMSGASSGSTSTGDAVGWAEKYRGLNEYSDNRVPGICPRWRRSRQE